MSELQQEGRLLYLFGENREEVSRIRSLSILHTYGFDAVETAYSEKHFAGMMQAAVPDLVLYHLGHGTACLQKIRLNNPYLEILVFGPEPPKGRVLSLLLHLEVLDYLPTPLCESALEQALKVYQQRLTARKVQKELAKCAACWDNCRLEIREKFWKDLCLGWVHGTAEEIEESASSRGIQVDKEARYRMILSVMKNQDYMWKIWGEYSCQRAIQKCAREIFPDIEKNGTAVIIYSRVVLILNDDQEDQDEQRARRLSERCQEELGADLYCYFSRPIYCDEIPFSYSLLLTSSKDDVLRSSHIVHVGSQRPEEGQLQLPPEWADTLYTANAAQFSSAVKIFLTKAAHDGKLSERNLRLFQQDMLQLFFNYLDSENLSAHDLYHDKTIYQLYKPAFQSIDGMVEWVNACVLRIAQILASCGEDQKKRVVSRMKTAIKSDLSGDLSIRRISAMVHLSPDYAGRIFREATGTTLHQYIVHKRMKYALTLLRSTNKSVAEIAVEVGYENVSHFISNFRDCFGETPKKLRAARRGTPQEEA